MGQNKKLRTLLWKNEQLNKSIDQFLEELREKKKEETNQKEEGLKNE